MIEEWRTYKTREINIEVSNFGNVRGTLWAGKVFNQNMIKIINGRKCINNHHYPIYNLVWKIFNGEKPKGYSIHHIDHNKLNDRLDNLMLMTNGEHSRHHTIGQESTFKGRKHTEKAKESNRIKHTCENNTCFGKHWYNNGVNNKHFATDEEAFSQGYFNKGKTFSHRKNKEGYVPWNKGKTQKNKITY